MTQNNRIVNEDLELIYNNRIHMAKCGDLMVPVKMPDGETINFAFNINFDGGATDVKFRPIEKDDNFTIEFVMINFGTELGIYVKTPINVGKYNDRNILTLFAMTKPKDGLPILDITVYLEKEKNCEK